MCLADIDDFTQHPYIQSCQTKMLVGRYCADNWLVDRKDFELAKARVHELAFVGLTDAYNMSVCLLYHMYQGQPQEWMFAAHARPGEVIGQWFTKTLPTSYWYGQHRKQGVFINGKGMKTHAFLCVGRIFTSSTILLTSTSLGMRRRSVALFPACGNRKGFCLGLISFLCFSFCSFLCLGPICSCSAQGWNSTSL